MPKQNYYQVGQLTDVAYLVLLTLTKPLHGYLVMSEIEQMTGGDVRIGPASLYTTLGKLTDVGFIEMMAEDNTKKIYHITDNGLTALKIDIIKRQRYVQYGERAMEKYQEVK